jgi:hypothetical protein
MATATDTLNFVMAAQRVQLPDVEKLTPRVIRILGGNPGKVSTHFLSLCLESIWLIIYVVYSSR